MLQILRDDGVDGVIGGETTISDEYLEKMLNRETCLKLFEKKSTTEGTETQSDTTDKGFQLMNEDDDGQGTLTVK